jgi:drug/metabolite transporter (DMT)-like permease
MFASLAIAAKIVLRQLPPFAVIAFRAPTATLILLGACLLLRASLRLPARDLAVIAVHAFFGITANQLLFIAGLQRSTATNAVVLGATIPVFTVGIALLLKREQATTAKLMGLAVAFIGALTVVGGARFEAGGRVLLGNLLMVLNSLSFSIYLVISRPILARYKTLPVITWTLLFGALGVLPFGAEAFVARAPTLSTSTWAALFYIAIFPTVGTYFLNAYALRRAPSSLVAIYIYVQPVIGATLAALFLGERPTGFTGLGAALIGLGIYFVNRSARLSRA